METASKELRAKVRSMASTVLNGGPAEAKIAAAEFKALGAVKDCNLTTKDEARMADGSDACVAWYAGQFLTIVDQEAWFAVNSWLNCLDRFCPPVSPT